MFIRLFLEIAAHYLRQRIQDVVTDFEPILLSSRDAIDKAHVNCNTNFKGVTEMIAASANWNFELQPIFVAFEVMERAEMRSQNVCFDEYLEREIWD